MCDVNTTSFMGLLGQPLWHFFADVDGTIFMTPSGQSGGISAMTLEIRYKSNTLTRFHQVHFVGCQRLLSTVVSLRLLSDSIQGFLFCRGCSDSHTAGRAPLRLAPVLIFGRFRARLLPRVKQLIPFGCCCPNEFSPCGPFQPTPGMAFLVGPFQSASQPRECCHFSQHSECSVSPLSAQSAQ